MPDLVELDRDHPGFRDPEYRARRNRIAGLALAHRPGAPPPDVAYEPHEVAVWGTALAHLTPLHAQYACPTYRARAPQLGFRADHVPSFAEVNEVLAPLTGFRLEPVAGLVTPRQFMERLAEGVFLATQYIRHHSAPLYTPEPDIIHELVGHAPMLADPGFAELNRLFGEATLRADARQTEALIRLYWYVLEFGVYGPPEARRVVGAGLLSSFGELGRFAQEAELRPFDLDRVAATPFDPTDYQGVLFVAQSEEALKRDLGDWLRAV
ncbi:MAG: phenylalanine 4-monooxygenase [Myxococcales bacterium]|nr:phenylalanine 4-monooxygenase [Myxococcales bacterium]